MDVVVMQDISDALIVWVMSNIVKGHGETPGHSGTNLPRFNFPCELQSPFRFYLITLIVTPRCLHLN